MALVALTGVLAQAVPMDPQPRPGPVGQVPDRPAPPTNPGRRRPARQAR